VCNFLLTAPFQSVFAYSNSAQLQSSFAIESDKGLFQRVQEMGQEIKRLFSMVSNAFGLGKRLVNFMGFKVFLLFMLTALFMTALHITGLVSGKPSFVIALLTAMGFWYVCSRVITPETGGDFHTIGKTGLWVMLPVAAVSFLGVVFRWLTHATRRWWYTHKSFQFSPQANTYLSETDLRKEAFEVGEHCDHLLKGYHQLLHTDSGERKEVEVDLLKKKQRLLKSLGAKLES